MALLEVTDLRTRYGAIEALKGISLTVEEGEVVTLIGSNGAGKTTTLRSISGLTPASRGTIVFAGEEITRVPAHEIVGRGIALAPEGRHCFPRMTVRENLDLGAHRRRGPEIADDMAQVYELFPVLKERARQKAWSSGSTRPSARSTAPGSRSSWSSRTPTTRSTPPPAAMCSRPDG